MNLVLIRIGNGQDAVTEDRCRGLRIIDVPPSARVLATLDGWKLEVPGQAPFWLPPDVQVVEPGNPCKRRIFKR